MRLGGLVMGLTKLGNYIVQSDARNFDGIYGEDVVVGLSTQKQMIITKADLNGVNLVSYKLFPPHYFAYVPDTSRRGDKMSLAYNHTENVYLVSSISVVFHIPNESSLISDYLFMYFNRPEFDRYSRFHSWGSARETFSWEEMCDIELELPSIDIQKKYVNIYNAIVANQQNYERGLEDLKLKFCESIGLLSDRNNIICISDEAHRTQTGVGAKLKKTDDGVFTTYGFAKYLRDSFPNACYCGFTGTPIDDTISVFGDVVDSYTMKESSDDGITVRIAYEPRLARVIVSDEQVREIQKYYDQCAAEGSTEEQIEASQRAMSSMAAILGHPDRIKKLARDIVTHYEFLCAEKPEVVQKAMVVCTDRQVAFHVLNEIKAIRPEWGIPKKAENESILTKEQKDKLLALPQINLVATRRKSDRKELYQACGTKEYRKKLDEQFKNNDSNFKIAIVVDMWITGFDVPALAVMYIDKPLQKHTLIQTISRVNRVFDGKDKGLVVDYIGIKNDMLEAIKKYGISQESPVDELNITLGIFRNHLAMIDELMIHFDVKDFYAGQPLERLNCLNKAAEYIQTKKEIQTRFMGLSRRLKEAYHICFPSGELVDEEVAKAQFYLAIRSIIYKQVRGDAPDTEVMNRVVENMVRDALICTGIESIVDEKRSIDLFSDEFLEELRTVKMPITKFNALLKLLRKAITAYGKTNKIKAVEFDERLKQVVEAYNNRDKLVFTSEVVADFVNDLSDKLLNIFQDLQEDKISFEKLGITYEEKAFYDILVKVRDDHGFPYADEKCLVLAKKIKELVDDKAQYADWSTRDDIKNQLNMDLTVLLYQNGYPPEWDEEIFEKVMAQAENFKKFSGDSSFNQSNNVVYQFQTEEPLSMVAESVPLYGDKNV